MDARAEKTAEMRGLLAVGLARALVISLLLCFTTAITGNSTALAQPVSRNGEAEARYAGRSGDNGHWTPAPTTSFGKGPCEMSIEALLSPVSACFEASCFVLYFSGCECRHIWGVGTCLVHG